MDEKDSLGMGEEEDAGPWKSIRFFLFIALGLTALGILFFAVA